MSSKQKKPPTNGVRYTDAKKQEVIDFVTNHNKANGRGGQYQASIKFNISPLTIAAWVKAANGDSPSKFAKKKPSNSEPIMAVRYSPEKKQEVVDFVLAYDAEHGRGGKAQAVRKYNISVLSVMAWLKASGKKSVKAPAKKAAKAAPAKKAVKAAPAKKAAKTTGTKKTEPMSELETLKAAIRALVN